MKLFLKGGKWWADARSEGCGRISLGTADRAEAERIAPVKLARALAALSTSTAPAPAGVTLGEAFRIAMRQRKSWKAAKAAHSLDDTYAALVARFGADRTLASITREDLLQWVEHMEKRELGKRLAADGGREVGLKPSTINHRLSLLSVLFKETDTPAPRMPRLAVKGGRIRTFTDEELGRIERWFVDHNEQDMADLVVVLSGTAMRLSEVLTLSPADAAGGMARLWDTKSGKPRAIPLSGRPLSVIERRAGFAGGWGATRLWTLTVDGAVYRWSKMRTALGYAHDREFVIHALRHTAITRLAAAGFNALQVQAFAGHRKIETTQRYTHLAGEDLRALSVALTGGK